MREGPSKAKTHKFAAIVDESLTMGRAMAVLGHLSVSIGAFAPAELLGVPRIRDASGHDHFGIAGLPYIILRGTRPAIKRVVEQSGGRDAFTVGCPTETLDLPDNESFVESLTRKQFSDIEYYAVALFGPREVVEPVTRRFRLWT